MRLAYLALACLTSSCSPQDMTSLVLDLSSADITIPDNADGLGFEATSDDGTRTGSTLPLAGPFPQTITLVPATERSASMVTIRVWLLQGDLVVTQRVIHTAFVSGQVTHVAVSFEAACLRVTCPDDVDCMGGRCIDEDFDAGPSDSGPSDAGLDAGLDAGPPEVCGGGDEDGDGFIDEGLPCLGNIVISEVATERLGLPTDEFVELFNTTMHEVDLSDVTLSYRGPADGAFRRLVRLPAGSTVPPFGHFLIVAEGYAGLVPADVARAWSEDLDPMSGAIKIAAGGDLDRLGWGLGDAEAAAVSAPWNGTYERRACVDSTVASMDGGADADLGNGLDCDNNAADFVLRPSRDPQNASSPVEALCTRLCAP